MLRNVVLVMLTALLIFVVPVSAQEEVMELDEVVVTASRYEESIMETPVSIEVIDQEEIEESNARNLAELLDTYTGVYIKDNGGQIRKKDVKIRGASADQVLVLLDGVPYNDHHNGGLDLSIISAENIEKVEIIKGPASVIYGANAMGGVINIITKKIEDSSVTKLDLGLGSDNTDFYMLSHNEKIDDLGIYLSYFTKNSNTYLEESNLDQENIFLKINNEINKYSDISFTFSNNISDKIIEGDIQDEKEQNLSLTWKRVTELNETNLQVFQVDRKRKRIDKWNNSLHEKEQSGLFLNNTNYFDKHTFNYGFEIKKNEINSTNIENGNRETTNKALFFKDNWNYNQKLDFIFAARYDDHEEYGSNLSPQIAANYKLNNNYITYLSYSEAFKAPTFDDLYGDYGWYVGNQDLKSEESKNYEIGLKFDKENHQGSIAYFERKVDNLIQYLSTSTPATMINIDNTSKFRGLELDLDNTLTKNLSSNLNYTYLDARDNDGERINYNPYHNAKLRFGYSLTEKSKLSFSGNLTAGRKDMPSHFVLNTGIKFPLNIREQNFDVNFSINNILDKEYEVNKGYPMPGRNFMINLSTKF